MPEMIEIEYYRAVAERTVGRIVAAVDAPDAWYLKGGTTARALRATLTGRTVTGTRRVGKLLMLDTDGPTLGLRFGMTGRLLVDGTGPIERLEYSSGREDPSWIRFALRFAGGGELRMVDPRRLGGVQLDPDTERLGTDALAVRLPAFRAALATSRAPVKAWLLDQSHIAGIGNLLADEILWRAGLDPARPGPHARPRRGDTAPSPGPADRAPAHQAGRQPHRRPPGRTGARRHLSARRRPAGAAHDRWSHHLLLPAPPALTWLGPSDGSQYPWPPPPNAGAHG